MADFYVTATLLNNWHYYLHSDESVQENAKQSFLDCLNKVKSETTENMQRGIDFENKVRLFDEQNKIDDDATVNEIGEIIKGGLWQEAVMKIIKVKDYDVLLFGYADVIKCSKIFDIKRVNKYTLPKYYHSVQHKIYMLCTGIKDFDYLISNGQEVYVESYFINSLEELEKELKGIISEFFTWLSVNNLFDIYAKKWDSIQKEEIMKGEIL